MLNSGADVVDEVSVDLFAGDVLALVGESGCGKTSTALAMLGYARTGTRIAQGSVLVGGKDLMKLSTRELQRVRGRDISYVPQDPSSSLNPRHRVGRQIAESLLVHGVPKDEADRRTQLIASAVDLRVESGILRRFPFQLSGGQQHRVAIAMALVSNPSVAVLDEPTTGLDVTTQEHLLAMLREVARSGQTAYIYVTHDLAVADGLANRVAVMYAGRVVEFGLLDTVFARPNHPYTALLLNSVPRLSVREQLLGIPGTAPPPGGRPRGCFFAPRCPRADDQCRTQFPPITPLGDGHGVRCWHAATFAVVPRALSVDRPPIQSDDVLSVQALTASHGTGRDRVQVLSGLSFSLSHAECLAIVGESGSGKTTAARCIVGLHRPDGGTVALHGQTMRPWVGDRPLVQRRSVQLVYQNPDRSLNPSRTVREAVVRPLKLYGLTTRAEDSNSASSVCSILCAFPNVPWIDIPASSRVERNSGWLWPVPSPPSPRYSFAMRSRPLLMCQSKPPSWTCCRRCATTV